jgi:hypothetical protein
MTTKTTASKPVEAKKAKAKKAKSGATLTQRLNMAREREAVDGIPRGYFNDAGKWVAPPLEGILAGKYNTFALLHDNFCMGDLERFCQLHGISKAGSKKAVITKILTFVHAGGKLPDKAKGTTKKEKAAGPPAAKKRKAEEAAPIASAPPASASAAAAAPTAPVAPKP